MYLREIPLHTRPCNVGNTSEPTLATLYGDFSLRLRSDFQNGSTHTGSHLPRLSLTFLPSLLSSSLPLSTMCKYKPCKPALSRSEMPFPVSSGAPFRAPSVLSPLCDRRKKTFLDLVDQNDRLTVRTGKRYKATCHRSMPAAVSDPLQRLRRDLAGVERRFFTPDGQLDTIPSP